MLQESWPRGPDAEPQQLARPRRAREREATTAALLLQCSLQAPSSDSTLAGKATDPGQALAFQLCSLIDSVFLAHDTWDPWQDPAIRLSSARLLDRWIRDLAAVNAAAGPGQARAVLPDAQAAALVARFCASSFGDPLFGAAAALTLTWTLATPRQRRGTLELLCEEGMVRALPSTSLFPGGAAMFDPAAHQGVFDPEANPADLALAEVCCEQLLRGTIRSQADRESAAGSFMVSVALAFLASGKGGWAALREAEAGAGKRTAAPGSALDPSVGRRLGWLQKLVDRGRAGDVVAGEFGFLLEPDRAESGRESASD